MYSSKLIKYLFISSLCFTVTACNNGVGDYKNKAASKKEPHSIITNTAHISTNATRVNMIETDITVQNTGSNEIKALNAAMVGAFTGISIRPGDNHPCQSISMLNPLEPNGTCTIKVINSQKDQAINNTNGSIKITVDGDSKNAQTLQVTAGTYLFAGGKFDTADGNTANHIAVWNGARWSSVGAGMDNDVKALAVFDNHLYAGGAFTTVDNVTVNNIAVWNGKHWSAVSNGSGMNGTVNAMTVFNNNLYVGGGFITADGTEVNHVAKWDGTRWSALSKGLYSTTTPKSSVDIYSLASFNDELYVGGYFEEDVSGIGAKHVAKWDGTKWSRATETQSIGSKIHSLAVKGDNLFAGGDISQAITDSRICRLNISYCNFFEREDDSSSWKMISSNPLKFINSIVAQGDNLYIGGQFNKPNNSRELRYLGNDILQWDGSDWSNVGDGVNGTVYNIITQGNNLYVGGAFTNAGTNPANKVATWNGAAWSALGAGMNNDVNALLLAPSLEVTTEQ